MQPDNAMPTEDEPTAEGRPARERTPGEDGTLQDTFVNERCEPAPEPEGEG